MFPRSVAAACALVACALLCAPAESIETTSGAAEADPVAEAAAGAVAWPVRDDPYMTTVLSWEPCQAPEEPGAEEEGAVDAEAAAAEPEPAQSAPAEPEPGAVEPDVWTVSGYGHMSGAYGENAPSDGSLALWKEGWWCAHWWSEAGRDIAACHDYVRIDGRLYAFNGTLWYENETLYEDLVGWAHEDGSIVFQTCSGGGRILVRYAPC